jgi:MoxR-like ATPase
MRDQLKRLRDQLTTHVLGSEQSAGLLIAALISNGHVLLQGAPGVGKTTLASLLARSVGGSFNRVQFTPDLLPSDILGYSMYNQAAGEFQFIQGPVFCNILLADEINRTNPRIQSALLECMNEHQVSIDGVTRKLTAPFMVIATQNNLYATGTFPLPEPQLDRFLLSIELSLPDTETQEQILSYHADRKDEQALDALLTTEQLFEIQDAVKNITVSRHLHRYIIGLSEATREHLKIRNGVSPRGSIALMRAAQAAAFMNGHPAVYPDDVKAVLPHVFGHRLMAKEAGAGAADAVRDSIEDVLEQTAVPV